MKVRIEGYEIHVATGGREHGKGRPYLMFLHGAGFNHLAWALQTRAFAYDGYNVIAADMPGHGLSEGEPIESVEEQAAWAHKLLDALGVQSACLIGHSQGGLIALEMAKAQPGRIDAIAFIATAASIPVNPQLIEQAQSNPDAARANMVDWSLGSDAHMYDNTVPGNSHIDSGFQTMRMTSGKALAADLRSCAAYKNGSEAAAALTCPVLCIFAAQDKMTPLKFGQKLAEKIVGSKLHVISDSGHFLPSERPREVNALLRKFLMDAGAGVAV